MLTSSCFSASGKSGAGPVVEKLRAAWANAIVGATPIVFGPGTLPRHAGAGWRTWGTRLIPSDLAMPHRLICAVDLSRIHAKPGGTQPSLLVEEKKSYQSLLPRINAGAPTTNVDRYGRPLLKKGFA